MKSNCKIRCSERFWTYFWDRGLGDKNTKVC